MPAGSRYWTKSVLEKVASTFDEVWYAATYWRDLSEMRRSGESVLDFYLRVGGRIGHDPHPEFSELFFRTVNGKVYKHLKSAPTDFGYLIFCGRPKKYFFQNWKLANPLQCENWRALTNSVDKKFIAENYPVDRSEYISELDFYIRRSRKTPISPGPNFSEDYYRLFYSEIERQISAGAIISGYHQFVVSGSSEGRHSVSVSDFEREIKDAALKNLPGPYQLQRQLESNIPGISRAVEFGYTTEIEYLTDPVRIKQRHSGRKGFLVFIPYYFPEIFFGGYLAFFDFIKSLKALYGGEFKLVIVRRIPEREQLDFNLDRIRQGWPEIARLFSSYHLLQDSRTIEVDGDYGVISFCAETHFIASDAARQLNVTPIFTVQEYEPEFHAAGSLRTFVRSAFDLPHVGIYNSRKLYEYFRDFTDIDQVKDSGYRYATFENAIKPMPWDWKTFELRHSTKGKKRLIVYARPELLGGRNEFAIIVAALKKAIGRGYLDESQWIFRGIGSMTPHPPVKLSTRSKMEMMPKLPLGEYEESILLGDVGISLISTPHPGIIHFQMASFGLTSITYAMAGRSAEWLGSQSKNLIPSRPTIDGLCEAIGRAAQVSSDLRARYTNATESNTPTGHEEINAAAEFVLRAMNDVNRG